MAEILKGAPVTAAVKNKVAAKLAVLADRGIIPTLAIVRVGDRADDVSYERSAMKACEALGIGARQVLFPADVSEDGLAAGLRGLNADDAVHGILLFRPLPKHLNEKRISEIIAPEKDVDGITSASLAGVFTGSCVGFAPCTAEACMELLAHYGIDCSGKRAVVVGRSLVVGKPVSIMLLGQNATVTVCHTKTRALAETVRGAEIVIVAAGKAQVADGSFFTPGQIVIDVGIHVRDDGSLCGDVKFDEAEAVVAAITPVPGGVGGVTTAVLLHHVAEAALRTL